MANWAGTNATDLSTTVLRAVTQLGSSVAVVTLSVVLVVALPRIAPWFFSRYGNRVIEPEIKLVFACLLILMMLADASNGHAVLPT